MASGRFYFSGRLTREGSRLWTAKVGGTAVEQVRNALTGTIAGVKVVLREPFKGDSDEGPKE